MDKTYLELSKLWSRCHCVVDRNHPSVMKWGQWVEHMIGPDNCRGFLIRSREPHLRGMFLQDGPYTFVPTFEAATIYSWGETAIRITNNRMLEAIRVDHNGAAIDSRGKLVGVVNNSVNTVNNSV